MTAPFAPSSLPGWLHTSTEAQDLLLAAHAGSLSLARGRDMVGEQAHGLFLRLADRKLAEPLRLTCDLVLTSSGHAMAETITRAWAAGPIRAEFAELCVLQAAKDSEGRVLQPADIAITTPRPRCGPALTADECAVAIEVLEQQGLIVTVDSWGARFVRGITGPGTRRLAQGLCGSSSEPFAAVDQRTYTSTINVLGDNSGNMAIGKQVTQTSTVYAQAVQHLDEALEEVKELPEELAVMVEPALIAARTDLATTDANPSRAHKLLDQAKRLLEWSGNDDGPVASLLRIIALVMGILPPQSGSSDLRWGG